MNVAIAPPHSTGGTLRIPGSCPFCGTGEPTITIGVNIDPYTGEIIGYSGKIGCWACNASVKRNESRRTSIGEIEATLFDEWNELVFRKQNMRSHGFETLKFPERRKR